MTEHTPIPWETSNVDPTRIQCCARGEEIADTRYASEKARSENVANADFTVRAVNAHAALVEALRALVEVLDSPSNNAEQERFDKARAALALSEAQP